MKRTVPHQHRILAERSWARGGPSPGEDVSRGRLGCPTCPRVDAAGGPRADTRPPPIQQPPSSQRSESRPLNSAARACRRPRQGRRGHPRRRKRLPAEGQPERPRKTSSARAKRRRRAAPHPATPRAGRRCKGGPNSHKKHSKDAGRRLEGQRRLRQRPRLRGREIHERRDPGPDRFSNTHGRRPPLARARSKRWPKRRPRRRV